MDVFFTQTIPQIKETTYTLISCRRVWREKVGCAVITTPPPHFWLLDTHIFAVFPFFLSWLSHHGHHHLVPCLGSSLHLFPTVQDWASIVERCRFRDRRLPGASLHVRHSWRARTVMHPLLSWQHPQLHSPRFGFTAQSPPIQKQMFRTRACTSQGGHGLIGVVLWVNFN